MKSETLSIDSTMETKKKRILVVDDRASDTRLVKLYLERHNEYVVREENDSKSALSAAKEFKPDLILLDLMMPGMDGQELAACFKANPKFKAIPIVFLTAAVTTREIAAVGGRIGKFPFLSKPIVLSEVADCIKQQLSG